MAKRRVIQVEFVGPEVLAEHRVISCYFDRVFRKMNIEWSYNARGVYTIVILLEKPLRFSGKIYSLLKNNTCKLSVQTDYGVFEETFNIKGKDAVDKGVDKVKGILKDYRKVLKTRMTKQTKELNGLEKLLGSSDE